MRISIIIPAWNEASSIKDAIERARSVADEIIVADAGSPDGTRQIAAEAGAIVVASSKGRGLQLAAGATAASGDVLLFVHADVRLGPRARAAIERALSDELVVGGNFYLHFDGGTFAARLFTLANHLRRTLLRIYYGDSAIFVRASTYASLQGFRALPIFEDYEFVRRLERCGRTAYVRDVVAVASARRFEAAPMRTLLVWTALQVMFSLGVSPDRLSRFYSDARPKARA